MIKKILIPIIASTFLLVLMGHSCDVSKKVTTEKGIKNGVIIYDISYPETVNNAMSFFFPKEMTLFFNKGNQRVIFKGSMDLYGLDFIHNNECDSFFTLLKVLEKRMYVPSSSSANLFIFGNKGDQYEIVFDDSQQKEIAGFQCQKAQITPNQQGRPTFHIWYTHEIGAEYPHRNTPFEKIPGIMMEFKMNYENIVFHLKAQKVLKEEPLDDFFIIPDNYERSSLAEIESLIKSVLN